MADITVTAASVKKGVNAGVATGTGGATIIAGKLLYLDSADNKLKLADADAAATAQVVGIALCGGGDNQPIVYQTSGTINIGGTVGVGEIYLASSTAGGIAIEGDIGSAKFLSIVGVGATTANIQMKIHNTGVAIA